MPGTLLFYDTETTGLPAWSTPSNDPIQPHLVEIAVELVDIDSRKTISEMDRIIKPTGWTIPDEAVAIHGITTEQANDLGIDETDALDELHALAEEATVLVGYNESFDRRICRIAYKRFRPAFADWWQSLPSQCVMRMAKPLCKMPSKTNRGFKPPKLTEACEILLGQPLANAHSARADLDATQMLYWHMQDRIAESRGV